MTDLIIGAAIGYEWEDRNHYEYFWAQPEPQWKDGKWAVDDSMSVCTNANDFTPPCGAFHCKKHWCVTKQSKSKCPCGRKECGRQIEPFVISLRQSGYADRCIMLTGNGTTGTDKMAKYGIEVEDLGTFTEHPFLIRPRKTIEIMKREKDKVRYILAVDVRDVVFQSNPITWIENHIGRFSLIVTTEGGTYGGATQSNKENARRLIATYGEREYSRLQDRPICNGGVIAGTPDMMIAFREDIQKEIDRFPNGVPGLGTREEGWPCEQAIMNHVLNTEPFLSRTFVAQPIDGFAFCGDHIKHGAEFREELMYPPHSRVPYPIFHQYLQWRKFCWAKYSEAQ